MTVEIRRGHVLADAGPRIPSLFVPATALWRHWSLFRRLLARDVLSAFRGSVLGLAWVVLIPLSFVAIYSFVFGVIVKTTWANEARAPFETPLIYFMSLMMFGFFMEAITRSANLIRDHATYVNKIVFPLDLLGWVLAGTALMKLGINAALLAGALAIVTAAIPWKLLVLPLLLAPFVVLTLGVIWIFSAVGAYLRDLALGLQAAAPVLTFLTPIFYSVDQVPPAARGMFYLNPLTFPIESARGAVFMERPVSWEGYGLYWLSALAVFTLGGWCFQRLRPGFADVV
ncbi:ABC transporter permease [Alsobacter soli]|uniref:ABC transporter permease n=1 Tax=Alsobacter soli TaxID=2109933 RepID=UPI001304C6F3|nr:ABC transporter permease [Alsobacter soli]